jgi:hypothetical protein
MRNLCTAALLCAALGSAQAADLQRESALVDGKSVPVSNKAELSLRARNDEQVQTRQLWYRRRGANGWAAWEQHPLDFGRNTPITWQPPEGHWQVYVRVIEVSGAADAEPTVDGRVDSEFVIDRTGPAAQLIAPASGAILSTGKPFTIQWQVEDPNLHSTPVALYWARDDMSAPELVADGLPNSGSYKWITPMAMSNQGRLILAASDKVLNKSEVASTAIIVDGAPPQCSILGPVSSQTRQVNLQIRSVDGGPARTVANVQLWHSVDKGANWTPGPKITEGFESIAWTAPNDGEYLLALVGTDVAGNANAMPVAPRDALAGILVDSQPPLLRLTLSTGVREVNAPADGSSRRVFKPGDQVLIDFGVDDMRLAENPVSIAFQADPNAPWQLLGEGLPADKGFLFAVPDVNSSACRIKVTAVDAAGNVGSAISNEPFTIDNKVEHVEVKVEL